MTRFLAVVAMVLALPLPGLAAGLTISSVTGTRDMPAAGTVTVDTTDSSRTATRFRLAQAFSDLPNASWRNVTSTQMNVTWVFPGFAAGLDNVVIAEIEYSTGTNVIVSAAEDMTARTGSSTLPTSHLNPSSGVLFKLASSNAGYGAWPLVQYNDQGASIMRFAPGNNFVPLDWSDSGFAWSTEHTRAVDKGEPHPRTVMVAHTYARWLNSSINVMDWSPSSTALLVDLAGDNLDLKGGSAYFAVLMLHADGRHARYHLRRALTIPSNGTFAQSGWYVPSGSHTDWDCTFASNGQTCSQMPSPGPDLRYIEAVEIVITDGSAPPTGTLKIRDLQVWQ